MGSKRYHSEKWKTFSDFLSAYLTRFFDLEWHQQEKSLPEEERHPLIKWIDQGREFMIDNHVTMGDLLSVPISGALQCYYDLAYSLYLVEHNCGIPELVIDRLKHRSGFHDVLHELWVAGWFIRAGFKLTYEDESDSDRSHCEFVALHPKTGRLFSVEAKRKQMNNKPESVGRQLKKALKKNLDFTRIIVIEANLANDDGNHQMMVTMQKTLEGLREREAKPPLENRTTDPAYVIITNNPFEHHPASELRRWAVVEGYKIPNLKFDKAFTSVRDMVSFRNDHWEILELMKSLGEHDALPTTFDGAIPELTFGQTHSPLIIGNRYNFIGEDGKPEVGELHQAAVIGMDAICIMRTPHGNKTVIRALTEEEMAAHSRHPETFFGQVKAPTEARDALDLYDSFMVSYKDTPKEKLLELMPGHSESLHLLSQPELARIYVELQVDAIIRLPGMENFGKFDPDR